MCVYAHMCAGMCVKTRGQFGEFCGTKLRLPALDILSS